MGQTGSHRLGASPRPRLDVLHVDASGVFAQLFSLSSPPPLTFFTRLTSRVSVVAILSPAPIKDSRSQEGAHWQRQLHSRAAQLKTGYGLFMQHSKFTSMVEVWLSAEIQRRNLDQSGERTARGWWWVFPTTCTADSVPARACACRRVHARACACLCEVTASNHGECEVTK